ncbi:PKD domain-containing protein, partial [Candidatus Gracilibacteria bacterium]|nr:PKD domain-containing protein [Candidatus Gracilibacteria bacterium]
ILDKNGNLTFLETKIKIFIDGKEIKSVYRTNVLTASSKGILFDPSKSVIANGLSISEYIWEFGDGNKDFFETGEAVRQFYDKAGNYLLKLSVKDENGKIYEKQIRIIIKNLTADIKINPSDIKLGAKVSFDGSESKSSDGKISSYKWVIKDGKGNLIYKSEEKGFSFTPKNAGSYTAELTVKNLQGKEDFTEHKFYVNSNTPKAIFNFKNKNISLPGVFVFDGGGSYDVDGDILKYSWDFDGDGKYEIVKGDKFKITYSYKEVGDYNVYLKVEDQYGEYDIFNQKISVNSVLNVDFDVDRYATQKGGSITFTPKVPVDVNSILWDFKDGKKETTSGTDKISHTFKESGIYTIKMTAINANGEENSIIKKVFIGDGEYPIGVFQTFVNGVKISGKRDLCGEGKDGIEITRLDQIEVNAKESVNIDNTHGGLAYTWDFGDGNFAETQVARHKYRLVRKECYPLKVSVKDLDTKKAAKISDTIRVKVVNKNPKIGFLQILADKSQDGKYTTPLKVKLNLENTYDEDGNIVKYKWYYYKPFTEEKLGYQETFTSNTEFLIEADGVKGLTNDYIFNVEVEDNEGGTTSIFETQGEKYRISVKNGETKSPKIDFEINKTQAFVGEQVFFKVKTKDNFKGKYSWDFDGDDQIDTTVDRKTIEHIYKEPGEYKVQLRIEDRGVFKKVYKTIYIDEKIEGETGYGNTTKTGSIIKKTKNIFDEKNRISTDLGIKLRGEGITLTSLNVRVEKYPENNYKLIAHITNSDASIYNGKVEFQIIKGKGKLLSPETNAINSIASTAFVKKGEGLVKIRIIAYDTIYGTLDEKIIIEE